MSESSRLLHCDRKSMPAQATTRKSLLRSTTTRGVSEPPRASTHPHGPWRPFRGSTPLDIVGLRLAQWHRAGRGVPFSVRSMVAWAPPQCEFRRSLGCHGAYGLGMGARKADAKPAMALADAVAAFEAHRTALRAEVDLLNERDRGIVRAIRAGARLEEAAEAAMMSRAAVSKAARRTLPSRTGRGGPYSRRRGSSAALSAIAEAGRDLAVARERTREAKAKRDEEIVSAVANGVGVSETAAALGMTPASVSVIARSGRTREATNTSIGAVASPMR